ncbi:MAG: Cytochrome oxidase subunit [Phycisphaerales bacterium]|nr:Cytochrome oxidase subunit [Phycisphaerales bacterium]MDB5353916.1 Cytochrome oxidase subunit [Phycisphaerales bacterium]
MLDFNTLVVIWFVLLGAQIAGYAVLDGFDLGVGVMLPIARTEEGRGTFVRAIGPVWDGNEVWLITFGGTLLTAFPEAYATIFSGFYVAFMILLFALIFRAVSIEFRGKVHSAAWRRTLDGAFVVASIVASLVFGIGAANAMLGVPLNARGIFVGSFLDLLGIGRHRHPTAYPLVIGLFTLAMFAMHGALYLNLKTPRGELHERVRRSAWYAWVAFVFMYIIATAYTLTSVPRVHASFRAHHWALIAAVIGIAIEAAAIANISRAIYRRRPQQAFFSSAAAIIATVFLFGMTLWPMLVRASNDPQYSWTAHRAASSRHTLMILSIVACIGFPLALLYTATAYWTFRGRVRSEEPAY